MAGRFEPRARFEARLRTGAISTGAMFVEAGCPKVDIRQHRFPPDRFSANAIAQKIISRREPIRNDKEVQARRRGLRCEFESRDLWGQYGLSVGSNFAGLALLIILVAGTFLVIYAIGHNRTCSLSYLGCLVDPYVETDGSLVLPKQHLTFVPFSLHVRSNFVPPSSGH